MSPKKLAVGIFMAIITLFPIVTLALPPQKKSELENRELQSAPVISGESLLDKSFMKDVETYLSDHFVGREKLVKAKTFFELLQLNSEVNGVFVNEKMLLENVAEPPLALTQSNADAMSAFATKYRATMDVSAMLVPTALELYAKNAPLFANNFNQTQYINDYYGRLKNIACIDAATPLAGSAGEYIFYKTDHHWTSLGAYYGYKAMANTLGFRAATIDLFNIEHASYDFLGTLYSKILFGEKLADTVDLYSFSKGNVVTEVLRYEQNASGKEQEVSYPSIFFRDYLNVKDKYSTFMGENVAIMRVKTNVTNGKKLVIFKDSYAHALMQFLPIHYEEIVLVDLRYLNVPLSNYINLTDYDQTLFLYNMAGFVGDSSVKKLSLY